MNLRHKWISSYPPSIVISDRNHTAIRIVQSPNRHRRQPINARSFRSINDPIAKQQQQQRKRSKSDISSIYPMSKTAYKRHRSKSSYHHLIPSHSENIHHRLSPLHIVPRSITAKKEKWIGEYFEDLPQFQSVHNFIAMKLQDLMFLTNSDMHPSPFRIAMACELLSTFIEHFITRNADMILMKRLLHLIVDGIYTDLGRHDGISYHALIHKNTYFADAKQQDYKLEQLQSKSKLFSSAMRNKFTKYLKHSKQRRTCGRAEFIVWKMFTNGRRKLNLYKMKARQAKHAQVLSHIFFKWRQHTNERKARHLAKAAKGACTAEHQRILSPTIQWSRQKSLELQRRQTEAADDLMEDLSGLRGNAMMEEDGERSRGNYKDLLAEHKITKMNLKYFKRISENRNVFVIEYQCVMKSIVDLQIAKDHLSDFIRQYAHL